ncbi:unnamed protein product [Rotaria magnacalcarata]|uniref:Uncharacterized protein n=1 Tax=Rotaria magnacalcarata TaxID=392030 RepID=A0A8S3H3Z8_9BILA|nr:unnamed protein product [Rotaria magnacalcarata]
MAFSLLFSISISIALPSLSFGGLQSWFCGTCTVCHPCPACEPHLNISPNCECQENLSNCNCNCTTNQNFKDYHTSSNLQQMSSQHNIHAAQMNSNNLKRHLFGWIIGLSSCTILLLFLIVLILFAPTLLRRYTTWHSKRKLTRRARFITKFNLIERSALPSVQPSYDDLLKQLSEQKQQLENLTRELPAPNTSLLTSSKIF